MAKKAPPPTPNILPLFSQAVLDNGSASLSVLREQCLSCVACKLHETRKNAVFGEGNPTHPLVAFVGEGPGEQEDLSGRPFIGKSGQLLTKMITAMGFAREEIYICNVVACRPPGNRKPEEDEIKACNRFMVGQLRAVRPQIVVALGATAAKALVKGGKPMHELRGQWQVWEEVPVRVTYHPSYLLRTPSAKTEAWRDLQAVLKKLGRELPETPNPGTP